MNKYKIKKVMVYFLIILSLYFYFTLLINDSFNKYLINSINSKYDIKPLNISKEILNSSLIKYKTIKTSNVANNKIINQVQPKEEKNTQPIVYIYNTHETEKYYNPFISDYSVTPDVRLASFILKDYLNDYNIGSFVQTKSTKEYIDKHSLGYSGTYEASRVYLEEELKKYNYKILLDIHRDSSRHKYTLYKKDNISYAKVMFVLATKHKNYKYNQDFANNLNNRLNKDYKGISRGILIRKDVIFNQDLSKNAILIELGGVDNTLEEINKTLKVLASIINDYIKEDL